MVILAVCATNGAINVNGLSVFMIVGACYDELRVSGVFARVGR